MFIFIIVASCLLFITSNISGVQVNDSIVNGTDSGSINGSVSFRAPEKRNYPNQDQSGDTCLDVLASLLRYKNGGSQVGGDSGFGGSNTLGRAETFMSTHENAGNSDKCLDTIQSLLRYLQDQSVSDGRSYRKKAKYVYRYSQDEWR
ncbi:unnamed protein product [Didymodactylos carnosus]|uniref:Uncharacterized protein n=1 Tax=Didymodactylos carnosus TaxID=1234261 RepID=A0A813Z9P9_9BILA|nr:unnamed protein product [Didymodactylos carnosus]CAF1203056.1 unnamed protein product [Didymodactylos carnosus]CAF3679574.1 unnamed protein product [Didymodactylos carnosus]CAF4012793.1 unnamed protein product [Didymodactylos carnosus]